MDTTSSKGSHDQQREARNEYLKAVALCFARGLADKLFLAVLAVVGALYFDFSTLSWVSQALLVVPMILVIQIGRELCMAPFSYLAHRGLEKYFPSWQWRFWKEVLVENATRRFLQSAFIVAATYAVTLTGGGGMLFMLSFVIAFFAEFILPWERTVFEPRRVTHEDLKDEALIARLTPMLERVGLTPQAVKVVKLSERMTRANAWMCGSQVWLGDTLLANCSDDGIDSVVAHELGHYHHQHRRSRIVYLQILLSLVVGYTVVAFNSGLFESFNGAAMVPLLLLVYQTCLTLLYPLELAQSRRNERQADEFALNMVGAKGARELRDSLEKTNSGWLKPWPIFVWFFSTHPTEAERLAHVDEWEARQARFAVPPVAKSDAPVVRTA